MLRWGSLLTRAAILLLIAAAIWIGRDALVRKVLISAGESEIGACIEIGNVRTSFTDGKIYLKQLAVADPRDGMRNLVQADSASLQIDWANLLRRRLVIENGLATQVVFGAPRSKSGALSKSAGTAKQPEAAGVLLDYDRVDAHSTWQDRFQYAGPTIEENQLNLVRTASEVFNRWDSGLEKHRSLFQGLKTEIREIHNLISLEANPLRNQDELLAAERRLKALNDRIKTIASDIEELDQQVVVDRKLLIESKQQDDEIIASHSRLRHIDGESITQILLNRSQIEQLEEILTWFTVFRESVPDPKCDFRPRNTRGRNVDLPGIKSEPAFLIKSLQLDGEGRLAGTNFHFSGIAKNFSNRPDLLCEPVTFEMRAQGNTHAVVRCVLDRSTEFRNDSISIHCPDLEMPARHLGDSKSLLVGVSPCRTFVDISLECRDGELNGRLNFDYSNLVMQIEQLDQLAGGKAVADRINLELASISEYKVQVDVSGPEHKPTIQFKSDLGDRFARKFNEILHRRTQSVQKGLNKMLETELGRLEQNAAVEIQRLASQLDDEIIARKTAVVADLRSRTETSPIKRF